MIEDPIRLFGRFVSAVISDALEDIQPLLGESKAIILIIQEILVRDLCLKAPTIAQFLAQEILKHSGDDSEPEVQGSQERGSGINPKRLSRRRKQLDPTYRLPKSSRARVDICKDGAEDLYGASGDFLVSNDPVTYRTGYDEITINQSSNSLMIEKPLLKYEGDLSEIAVKELPQEGVQGQSSAYGHSVSSMDSESQLY